jgi:hypothetical protein
MDGKKHRVPVEGDRQGRLSGTYIGHLDGYPAGYAHNFKAVRAGVARGVQGCDPRHLSNPRRGHFFSRSNNRPANRGRVCPRPGCLSMREGDAAVSMTATLADKVRFVSDRSAQPRERAQIRALENLRPPQQRETSIDSRVQCAIRLKRCREAIYFTVIRIEN